MAARLSPALWPLLALASPVLVPRLLWRNSVFKANGRRAQQANRQRIAAAQFLALPELDYLTLTVLVEQRAEGGFRQDPGVSYLITTNLGTLLFDVGFGPDSPTLPHNANKLGLDFSAVEAMAISHLHPDHMGGMIAFRSASVRIPSALEGLRGKPCFLPVAVEAPDLAAEVVTRPRVLAAGVGTTGPLSRSLFFLGMCEEQALVAHVRDKGIVVITGCGHPTVERILEMVRRLSAEPLYAIAGGIHFPVTASRSRHRGMQVQMFMGTGKPPWRRIGDSDLSRTIEHINKARPHRVLLSAHDTCDHSLARLSSELVATTDVLQAGAVYCL